MYPDFGQGLLLGLILGAAFFTPVGCLGPGRDLGYIEVLNVTRPCQPEQAGQEIKLNGGLWSCTTKGWVEID